MEDKKKVKGIIEAILFTMGTGRTAGAAYMTVLEMDREPLQGASSGDEGRIQQRGGARGICLIELDDSWQICTKIETYDYVRKLVSQPKKRSLTDVMLETLSIIAYKQPVTKQEIEAIRGVKCDFAVNKLVEYKLVKELGTAGHHRKADRVRHDRGVPALLWRLLHRGAAGHRRGDKTELYGGSHGGSGGVVKCSCVRCPVGRASLPPIVQRIRRTPVR